MKIVSNSVSDTINIGSKIAKYLKKSDIVCLFGNFGSGKTIFIKGIAKGLGIKEDKITSSSFILIRYYPEAKIPFYHFDLYRLKNPKDILNLGYQEYLYDEAIIAIEWADRLKYLLPNEYLKLELLINSKNKRTLKFSAKGKRFKQLLSQLKKEFYLKL